MFVGHSADAGATHPPRRMRPLTPDTLSRIIAIQTRIAGEFSMAGVMQLVVESAQEITNASGAVVELVHGDHMVYRATSGSALPHLGLRIPIVGSLSGLCLRTGDTLRCDDAELDDRVDRAACRRVGVRSMLVVPLRRVGETIGVLKVMSTKPHALSDSDTQVLQLLAGFIASALHNAEAYEQARRQALHDAMTGLANRVLFLDRVTQSLAQLRRLRGALVVLYIDLDGFKAVNDHFGHAAGDEVLVAVADRLRRTVRDGDTVARIGGDEFAVLAIGLASTADAAVVERHLGAAIGDAPFTLTTGTVVLGASIGVAVADGPSVAAEGLLREADAAMYRSKEGRRSGPTDYRGAINSTPGK